MRAFLDSLATRLDEARDISRYLTGLLVFLGLLGTFWGIFSSGFAGRSSLLASPPMDELLRIVAAVGITLAVAAFAVMFFMWVFS
jgi:hypothetical protein